MQPKTPHSVVVPLLNEMQNSLFSGIVEVLSASELEVLYVDGGSLDGTLDVLAANNCRVVSLPESNRAQRLNHGLLLTTGKLVLLHHPRSLLPREALKAFADLASEQWGGFTHSFDLSHPILKFTSFYSNHVRFRRGIVYLDHCIFAPRRWLLAAGGVPDLAIFEDTALSTRLRKYGAPFLMPFTVKTSAIRFKKNGIYRQSIMNQVLKLGYYARLSRSRMNKHYEKDLDLNAKVSK